MATVDAAQGGSREDCMEPMMVNRDMTPADVAAVTGNGRNDDWGGGALWIVVLFLFMFCNGGWNRGSNGEPVTESGLCDAMNFNNLENAVGRLADSNVATQAAEINANTTAQVQKVLDAITGNRMAEMQNQINQLQLNEALCGVVRFPNATTYTAGANPYFAQGCGCGAPAF